MTAHRLRSLSFRGLGLLTLVAGLAVSILGAGQRGLVDWGAARAVAVHSDDWGLAGYVPSLEAARALDLDVLRPGHFPAAYLESTLESADDVARLAALLSAHRGRDGERAVFQPNYILGSLAYQPEGTAEPWHARRLPDLPPLYERPGLWDAVRAARDAGVWSPELHGLWHYDPARRKAAVRDDPAAARAAAAGVLLFPEAARAHEMGPQRGREALDAEFSTALAVFNGLFDLRPASVIAPDYRWGSEEESRWLRAGIHGVQAKREQRSDRYRGAVGRLLKAWERGWAKAFDRRRVFLERNARLETAQMPDVPTAVARCLASVGRAWDAGRPAIIETHRLNYAHLDAAVAEAGRTALDRVLTGLESAPPTRRPLYLADREIVALERRGVSVRRAGGNWILRNLTHARRPVFLPESGGLRIVWLAPGAMRTVRVTPLD